MKTIHFFLLLVAFAIVWTACQNPADQAHAHHGGDKPQASAGSYACPMHPEVRGNKGDTCHRCGMELVKTDAAADSPNSLYRMQFTHGAIEPGKPVKLSFRPEKTGTGDSVALEWEHEKKIHLIVVSEDLAHFDHLHPEPQPDGRYVVEATFPAAGAYRLYADYKPQGAGHVVNTLQVSVPGTPAAPVRFQAPRLSDEPGNGYTVSLRTAAEGLTAGQHLTLLAEIGKDGKTIDASALDNYLGAKAHMVLVGVAGKEYLHVHPTVENGRLALHTRFPQPGFYRGWLQFIHQGRLYTADFVLQAR